MIWLLVTLRLVVVPLVIATIIASAVSPLMRVLRARGVPPALAAIAAHWWRASTSSCRLRPLVTINTPLDLRECCDEI